MNSLQRTIFFCIFVIFFQLMTNAHAPQRHRYLQNYNPRNDGTFLYDSVAGPNATKFPSQIHINQWVSKEGWRSGKASTMFSWVSDLNYDCPATVMIALYANSDFWIVPGSIKSKQFTRLVKSNYGIVNYTSPFMHNIFVDGLDSDTRYRYKVGADCEGDEVWSEWISYRTPPAAGTFPTSENGQVFAIAGDLGQTEYTRNTIQNILRYVGNSATSWDPESLIILGDLAYADGEPGLRWDRFQEMFEPLASVVNTLVFPGNHEVSFEFDDVTYDAMVHYVNRYFMPGNYSHPTALKPKQYGFHPDDIYNFDIQYVGGSSYYFIEQGMVTFIALNTYNGHKYGPGSHMYTWLENVLANVDRSITPWVIVGMHAPWYSTNAAHMYHEGYPNVEMDTAGMATYYEPLFNKYKVNMVFSGHVHAYERFHPIGLNTTCDNSSSGPTYITVGDAGNYEGLSNVEILADFDQLKCSAYRNNEYYGFGFLKIHNTTTAEWVWLPNPQGSERISAYAANFSHIKNGYVDQVFVENYAITSTPTVSTPSNSGLGHKAEAKDVILLFIIFTASVFGALLYRYFFVIKKYQRIKSQDLSFTCESFTNAPANTMNTLQSLCEMERDREETQLGVEETHVHLLKLAMH